MGEALPTVVVHRALALAYVCGALEPATKSMLAPMVRDALSHNLNFTVPELPTGLLSAALAADEAMRCANDYFAMLRDLLEADPVEAADERAVLARLAVYGSSDGSAHITRDDLGPQWFAAGTRPTITYTLATVEALTRYGTWRAVAEPPVAQMLEGAALQAASLYDLPRALRCLRGCNYLGAGYSFGAQAVTRFVLLSRCVDGSYGHYESAFASLRVDPRAKPDRILELKLSLLMQALWTLGEVTRPAWRLFGTLGPREAACSTATS